MTVRVIALMAGILFCVNITSGFADNASGSTSRQSIQPEIPKVFPMEKPQFENILKKWSEFISGIDLLKPNQVYQGLESDTPPALMAANWLRYAHVFAYNPQVASPLFSKAFRSRLMMGPGKRGDISDPFTQLYNLCKIYYHQDLKYSKNDEKAFAAARDRWAPVVKQTPDELVFGDDKGKIIWKLEDGAWRLDRLE